MQFSTYLIRRNGVFYYRIRIPLDLVSKLGRREIWVSLRTGDRRSAQLRHAVIHAEHMARFSELRVQIDAKETKSAPKNWAQSMSPELVPKISLDGLVGYWATQSERRPRTLMDVKAACRELRVLVGNKSATEMTKRDAVAFKDRLVASRRAPATIAKYLGLIKSVFGVAHQNDLLAYNPFQDVRLVKQHEAEKSRLPFEQVDLEAIFSSSIYRQGDRPKGGAGEAAYWLPLMALYTGMRLEEMGQLTCHDVKLQDGIHFIDIRSNEARGQRLKSASSKRRVPIHPYLIDLGTPRLVTRAEGTKNERLFPLLRSAGVRQLTASFSQWFGRYLRQEIGVTDRRKTFHSFRHTFKDACREVGITKEIHDRLTGHTTRDIGDTYGSGVFPLAPLDAAIKMLPKEWGTLLASK